MPRKIHSIIIAVGLSACACVGALVDKVPGAAPDVYVDFAAKGGAPFDVAVSNACGEAGNPFVRSFKVEPSGGSDVTVGMRRYRGVCAVYADGREIGRFDDFETSPFHILIDDSADAGGEVFVQRLAPFAFADAFMVAEGDKTGLQNWEKLAGDWSLHAVTGRNVRATERKALARYPTQARSPNFYCLNGFGDDAVITAGESFYSHYSLRASVHQDGGTNGLAFMVSEDGAGWTFTAQQNPASGRIDFILRSGCKAGETCGEFVAGVETELTPGQWYMLEVRLTEDMVLCLVDGIAVIRRKIDLPPGGRFGLYSSTSEAHSARFDDVEAATWTGVDFSLADNIPNRRREASFGVAGDPPASITLPANIADGGVLELSAGSGTNSSARLVVEGRGGGSYALFLIDGTGATNDEGLVTVDLQSPGGAMRSFTLDATSPGIVDGRVDGVTRVTMTIPAPPLGCVSYKAGNGVGVGYPNVARESSAYTDRFEKNKFYVTDPFMRHWASTEGQWLTYTNGLCWYKDDVINRALLTVPAIDGIDLGLGVGEDGRDADIRILCQTNTLSVFESFDTNAPALFTASYAPAAMVGDKGDMNVTNMFLVRFDGSRFTIAGPGGERFAKEIPYPHSGRRMLFRKMPAHYTANVFVHREPVMDCLFGESLHDWTINGGTWEVINRFQCNPDWSHMNGENADSVAAIWSKYQIEGDFCATFVCGMRHGWYERVGDFDMTVMTRAQTPSQGYTLKITDWDPDHSQRRSRLLKDGVEIASTNALAAPRFRDGNVRTGYEPMVAKGRDVHGAWYTVKFRKGGKHLEAYFDNVQLFSIDDPEPLASGSFGVWTYRNSMVVARVRVAAEKISPRPFRFSQISPEPRNPTPAPQLQTSNFKLQTPQLLFSGFPVDLLRPEIWHAADDVSCPAITFSREDGESVMTVTSLHGAGSFLVSPTLPAETTSSSIAGWAFEVARSPEALFNLEFSLADGAVTNGYSYAICGEREAKGPRRVCGAVPVPAPSKSSKLKVWTPVTVWIPATGSDPRTEQVLLEGFGNLVPGDVQQGLRGNIPGSWYAIRRLHPIYRGEPNPDNTSDNVAAFAREIQQAFTTNSHAGRLNSFRVPASVCATTPTIHWILPPADNQGLIAEYLPTPTNAIRVSSSLPWPNNLLSASDVTVAGSVVPLAYIEDNALYIPYARPLVLGKNPVKVSFKTAGGGRPFTQLLPADAFATERSVPRVASIAFPASMHASYESFESRAASPERFRNDNTSRTLRFGDPEQSSYIHFCNDGKPTRLSGTITNVFMLANNPLLSFRYRGDDMALVNFQPFQNVFCHFADNSAETPARLDGEWHTSLLRLSRIEQELPPRQAFAARRSRLVFSSAGISGRHDANQTGLFSYLDLDDIALGPAIGKGREFGFRPVFTAPVAGAEYAITSGNVATNASWVPFEVPQTNFVSPSLEGLADGIHHLLVRAAPDDSCAAPPVADIPFIYDTTPPAVSLTLNDNLVLSIAGGRDGAVPVTDEMRITANGEKLDFSAHADDKVKISPDNSVKWQIRWSKLARAQIQKCPDGSNVVIQVTGISDGAGNKAKPVTATAKINFASDTLPPSWTLNNTSILRGGGIHKQSPFFASFARGMAVSYEDTPELMCVQKIANPEKIEQNVTYSGSCAVNGWTWNTSSNRWFIMRFRIPEECYSATNMAFALDFVTDGVPKDAKFKNKSNTYRLEVPSSPAAGCTNAVQWITFDGKAAGGAWIAMAVDTCAFLHDAVGTTSDVRVRSLALRLPKKSKYTVELDYAVVMRDYAKPDAQINARAYDASGIDGVYSGDLKVAEGLATPTPAALYKLLPGKLLPELKFRDRAGNSSVLGFIVPLPPRGKMADRNE